MTPRRYLLKYLAASLLGLAALGLSGRGLFASHARAGGCPPRPTQPCNPHSATSPASASWTRPFQALGGGWRTKIRIERAPTCAPVPLSRGRGFHRGSVRD